MALDLEVAAVGAEAGEIRGDARARDARQRGELGQQPLEKLPPHRFVRVVLVFLVGQLEPRG